MNTLLELNTYSNSQIPFEDDRSLIITTATTDTTTQSVTIPEDSPVDLTTFGVTFSELRSLDDATADNITLRFGFYAANNPIVEWPTKDAFIEGNTKYNNITFVDLGAGTYEAQNIQLNSDYLAVLANTRIIARDQDVPYTYIITVSWPGNSYTQDFDVTTVPSSAETNLNGLSLTARSLFAHLLFDPTLDPTPAITDTAPGNEYSLELTSGAGATLSTTQAGTPTTSVTVTGDRDTANAALSAVYYSPLNGYYNQTDTISYTLTVTNPSIGFPYVSETGSFSNYVPVFAEVDGIVGRATNSSAQQDLFLTPYPTVSSTAGITPLQMVITTTTGEVKPTSATGTWGNSVTLSGDAVSLTNQLQSVKYRPPIVTGTNDDTLSYTLTFSGFNLDSGSWIHETTIDTLLTNLNGTGDTVTDIASAVMFPAGYNSGNLPDIASTDPNTQYDLTLTVGSGTGEVNGSTGSVSFNGSPSTIETALLAATYKPLVQDTTHNITYAFTLRGVTLQTGSFDKTLNEYFRIDDVPATITYPDQQDRDLFYTAPVPVVVDNTTGTNSLSLNMLISGTATPGVFNSQTTPTTGTVTYTGSVSSINTQIAATTYDPYDYVTANTDVLGYTLTAGGIDWVTGVSSNISVPPQIEFFDFTDRSFVGNSINDDVFLPASGSPNIQDNSDPTRILNLTITASAGTLIKGYGQTSPYANTLQINGTESQINAILSSTVDPIGFVPNLDGSVVDKTINTNNTSMSLIYVDATQERLHFVPTLELLQLFKEK